MEMVNSRLILHALSYKMTKNWVCQSILIAATNQQLATLPTLSKRGIKVVNIKRVILFLTNYQQHNQLQNLIN